MKNNDLLDIFINGGRVGSNYTKNLHIVGDRLINYNTIIATRKGDVILLNNRKYSSTTSRHQNYIKRFGGNVVEVEPSELY